MIGPDGFVSPAEAAYLGLPGYLIHAIVIGIALVAFLHIMWRRFGLLLRAAPDPRIDRIGTRIFRALVVGFGQSRQPRYRVAGILHILIFIGFLVLTLRSLTLLGEGFASGFELPLLGDGYNTVKDITALIVLLACIVAFVRRAVFKPERYHDRHATTSHGGEAYLILGLISFLMLADAVYEGSAIAAGAADKTALPFASIAGAVLGDADVAALSFIHLLGFWLHNVALLFFLCYLPVSKHFHVITAIPNVFLSNVKPVGEIKPPRHDETDLDNLERLGVGRLEEFTWKHILDFYSCTDCGRCSDHCPAYATGTPLSPRMISVKSRDLAYAHYPVFGRGPGGDGVNVVGSAIEPPELWACTTCGACEEACPVMIEYVDKIVDMRRFLVEEGEVPTGLQKAMADLEKRGNPYGKPGRLRADWLKDAAETARALKKGDEAETLFFTDSCGAYDPRIQEITRSTAAILAAAGEDIGTLGKDEVDSGHEARRLGEEGLFETLRDKNLEAMEARHFERIVTTDPHAMNALLHDGYDLEQPVLHHTQAIAGVIKTGKVKLNPLADGRTYTFHDPCYLGRHNGEYDAPREALKAIPGLKHVEMERSRNRSFCCGGGSLYLFYEGESESRMGEQRIKQAAAAGADVVVTACPFCMINLEDAAKVTGKDIEVMDIAEVVEKSMMNDY